MRIALALIFMLTCVTARAASIEMLKGLLQQTTSGKARFAQIVVDKNLKELQKATGTMQFVRPGLFRWQYDKPYEQTIVGDGAKLWIYDKDLNQVTVRKLDKALGGSPAALLAGSNEIDKLYTLTNLGPQEGLDWLEAVPKSKDNTFERIRLGFSQAGLEAMELRDQFAQTTVIKFAGVERNPKIAPEVFRFTPPKGADVITD
ncbi:MAG: outer membrane lipoprotein chaperone LolA [Betaproteobacteria bacterium]|nr:outer membrane lipoprotein chaperone LolA [Betaproteobacteria bacterium]